MDNADAIYSTISIAYRQALGRFFRGIRSAELEFSTSSFFRDGSMYSNLATAFQLPLNVMDRENSFPRATTRLSITLQLHSLIAFENFLII